MAKSTIATVDAYIAQYSPAQQKRLGQMRAAIREAAPTATEKISWGMATYVLNGNLAHFAQQKKHIGFYPGADGVEAFLPRLQREGYKTTKGGIQLPDDAPLPLGLVQEIVRWRVVAQQGGK